MLELFSRWLRRYQGIEANPLYRLAADVTVGRMPLDRAIDSAQSFQVNGRIADGDLIELDHQVEFDARANPEFALNLARLNVATAQAKGFEKVLVDLRMRVADLLIHDRDDGEREHNLREALITAQRISYVAGQKRALNRLARGAFERGETEMARDLLIQQLDAGREESDTRDDIQTAILLADIALTDGDVANAHDLYHRAARSARRIGDYSSAVDALLRQVAILRERGDLHGCLMLLQQASDAADRTVDDPLQAEVAFRTGALMRELDMPEEATERLEVALDRARRLGDLSMESRALGMLSRLDLQLGRRDEAMHRFDDVVALESRLGNRTEVARAKLAKGQMFIEASRPAEAIRELTDARDLIRQVDDPVFSIQSHGLLGRALMLVHREAEALNELEHAVHGARAMGDIPGEARWLLAAGEAMLRSGQSDHATALAERAEELARLTEDNALRSEVYHLVGQIALAEQRLPDAEDAFMSAAAAGRAAGMPGQTLQYLPLLARLAAESGQSDEALRYIDAAIDEASATSEVALIPRLHSQAARLLMTAGQVEGAEQRYMRAVDTAAAHGDDHTRGRALQGIAAIYDKRDDLETALDFYRDALQASMTADDQPTVAAANYNIGAILFDQNRDDEARNHLIQARDHAEQLRDFALGDRARSLLRQLTPPSVPFSAWDHDDEELDLPISEEPSRPRHTDPPY